jgi:murE/murF fusion protein
MQYLRFFNDFFENTSEEEILLNEISSGLKDIISGIACDSRKVKPGNLFVAIKGTKSDGIEFVPAAIKNGAKYICVNKNDFFKIKDIVTDDITVFAVDDTYTYLGYVSSMYYDNPSTKLDLIGITGTNGKTTTTYIIESILKQAKINSGVIGTINQRYNNKLVQSNLTTPNQIDINSILDDMLTEDVKTVAMEVSSHALDQKRVLGLRFKTVIFTNLTHDHLDYHINMENYFVAKSRLFNEYDYETAVVNIDDDYGIRLWESLSGDKNRISYGFSPDAMVRPRAFYSGINGIITRCITPRGEIDIKSRLIGRHNLLNILTAISAGISLDINIEDIKAGIENITFVPGRLEPVSIEKNISAFVDYAHTPDALKNVLSVLREIVNEKLIVVFGCGGDRDRDKRSVMAEIAGVYADHVIITSDNPRSEDPDSIIFDILKGTDALSGYNIINKDKFMVIPDRRPAIKAAAMLAKQGDCILIAGKGHEDYQIIGDKKERFLDHEEIKAACSNINSVEILSEISSGYKLSARVDQIMSQIEGTMLAGDSDNIFMGISTDTRNLKFANLFVALKGERFDAHDYLDEAVKKGVSALVIDRKRYDLASKYRNSNVAIIGVEDTLHALGDLAKWHRERLGLKTIGITGSCGKTSSKEFIAAVVAKKFDTLKTKGNFNNLIGLPLTLLGATPFHEWAALEMGMNQKGEISRLCEIARPQIGLITTIQPAHLEYLGGINGVINEKKALFESLLETDIALINMDDPILMELSGDFSCQQLGFSFERRGEDSNNIEQIVCCKNWRITEKGETSAVIDLMGVEIEINLKTMGRASVQNALSAIAIGHILGISTGDIKDALEEVAPVRGRLNPVTLSNNFLLIDDSYNASPASMKEAMENLIAVRKNTKKIAIIGDMLELGENTHIYHKELGASVFGTGIDEVIYVGENFMYFNESPYLKRVNITHFNNVELLIEWLSGCDLKAMFADSTVLLKASNSIGLRKAADFIIDKFKEKD